MKYELEPYGNILVVEMEDVPTHTPGGLEIPETARKKPTIATVVAVGMGQKSGWNGQTIEPYTKVGDKILVYPHGIQLTRCNDQVFKYLSESDCIGRLREVKDDSDV